MFYSNLYFFNIHLFTGGNMRSNKGKQFLRNNFFPHLTIFQAFTIVFKLDTIKKTSLKFKQTMSNTHIATFVNSRTVKMALNNDFKVLSKSSTGSNKSHGQGANFYLFIFRKISHVTND